MIRRSHIQFPALERQIDAIRPLLGADVELSLGAEIPVNCQLLVTEFCSAEKLDQLTDLKHLLFPSAGVPVPMRPLLQQRPHISAHNLHYNDLAVSETALSLLLAVKKQLLPLDQSLRRGHWSPSGIDTTHAMLAGSTAMILGYGAIGQQLAKSLTALSVNVRVMKRNRVASLPFPCYTANDWQQALPDTDILISTLPATTETHHLINQSTLGKLPPHAVLINVGRADTVDEEALYQALKNQTIYGAGIDVWWNYPDTYPYEPDDQEPPCLPANLPYQDLDNVLILPHRGSDHRMKHLQQRLHSMLAEQINLFTQGLTPASPIDPLRGY